MGILDAAAAAGLPPPSPYSTRAGRKNKCRFGSAARRTGSILLPYFAALVIPQEGGRPRECPGRREVCKRPGVGQSCRMTSLARFMAARFSNFFAPNVWKQADDGKRAAIAAAQQSSQIDDVVELETCGGERGCEQTKTVDDIWHSKCQRGTPRPTTNDHVEERSHQIGQRGSGGNRNQTEFAGTSTYNSSSSAQQSILSHCVLYILLLTGDVVLPPLGEGRPPRDPMHRSGYSRTPSFDERFQPNRSGLID